MSFDEKDTIAVNALRALAIDMVEKANSGHPGLPLGAAPMAYVLWTRHLRHNPEAPTWADRDRFVLSAGHGSAMLYSLLHLSGYGLSMEDLRRFRQLDSLTPGHPEYRHTPGVETTTGPLGQGFANAVGMALAERTLAGMFNTADFKLIDHHTFVLCGDGDLMEGVAYEAASLAGHLKLNKLVALYDSNGITIEGSTGLAFNEDVKKRFLGHGWKVLEVENGDSDLDSIDRAIRRARNSGDAPTLIIVKTHIGFGSPKEGSRSVHGEPLNRAEVEATKKKLGVASMEPFFVPAEAREAFERSAVKGAAAHKKWGKLFDAYSSKEPEKAALLRRVITGGLPEGLDALEISFDKPCATREAGAKAMNALADLLPELIGGSADLGPSTKTDLVKYPERTLHFGIREHAMGSVMNGMALHGGLLPFGSTFLVFSDYVRPALRLAAIMGLPEIFAFTHDGIGVGEDGPTHQPVEHLMSLRLIPGMTVMRPADALETAECWKEAVKLRKPVCLALSRQKLPLLAEYSARVKAGVKRGAYALTEPAQPRLVLAATGSEVHLALEAAKILEKSNVFARVVSVPSFELMAAQGADYRKELFKGLPVFFVEAGRGMGASDLFGSQTRAIGVETYGASAPAEQVYDKFGLTPEKIAVFVKERL